MNYPYDEIMKILSKQKSSEKLILMSEGIDKIILPANNYSNIESMENIVSSIDLENIINEYVREEVEELKKEYDKEQEVLAEETEKKEKRLMTTVINPASKNTGAPIEFLRKEWDDIREKFTDKEGKVLYSDAVKELKRRGTEWNKTSVTSYFNNKVK